MASHSMISSIVSEVLTSKLAPMGYAGAEITVEKDFDGEDVIRVTAKLSEPPTDGELLFEAASDIRQRLIAVGDDRFVFVRQSVPTHWRNDGDDDAEGSRPL